MTKNKLYSYHPDLTLIEAKDIANINQTNRDRQRERNNIRAAILTNTTVWITSILTTIAICFNAYTDKQALSISRKDHYLQHKILLQQQSQKLQLDTALLYRQYLDSGKQEAKPKNATNAK